MTSPLAGKRRIRCDVCLRKFYYVVRTAAALELRPYWHREAAPAGVMRLPAGAYVCDRCVKSNGVERSTNPLPLQKHGAIRASHRIVPALLEAARCTVGTSANPEADRLRRAAAELRSIGDALVELGRMRGTHDRLNVLADELVVISNAAEVADLLRPEPCGRVLEGGRA